ncbi:TonB-dependent siderophore receptor [Leptolyngbya sp. AN03gr2]|uniref:TonB-dependent siderophore receptor n=1 Tax=unclassified Leptolyngbya TaxID=2650499 RepID=UPI003D3185EE
MSGKESRLIKKARLCSLMILSSGSFGIGLVSPALGEENTEAETPKTAQVKSSLDRPATTVKEWMAQIEAQTGEEPEEEEITVTGDRENRYRVPNATTGTRTDTPLRDVPANVQVVPRQVLEDQGATRIDEALRNVGGVTFNSSFGNRGQDFQIRGFSATQFRNGLREDTGACCSFNNRTAQETADLERIEVLKGPASVLFGAGEPGGVINFVTKKPLTTPFYNIGFTAGSFNFYRPTLDFSGPLTPDGSLAYRLNVAYESGESFRDFVESRRYFVAPSLAWRISPNTTLTLEASYLQDRRTFDRGLIVLNGSDRPADLPLSRALFDPRNSTTNIEETRAYLFLDHKFAENLSLRSAFRYTTSFESDREGTSNIVGLLDDNRTVEIESYFGDQFFETFTFQNDLTWKFNTGSIAHTLLFGIELANNKARYGSQVSPEQQALTGGLLDIFEPNYDAITYTGGYQFYFEGDRIDQRTFGLYLQDQIALADNLKLLIGGRFDSVQSEQRFGDFSEDNSDSAFSPRLGIVYQPSRAISLYASYSRSFVPVAGRSVTNTPFKPERGTQYEIGVKADIIENRLSATLSAYDITKSNVATTDPNNPDFSIQVGEQRGRGIDLDIGGEILPGWNVLASYAYIDAKITQDNTFEVGNRLNNIPRHTASLWTTYTIQSGNLRGLGFGAGLFFNDRRIGDLDNSFSIPGYTRFDAALYYTRNNFRAALNFKNLFNTQYFAAAQNRFSVIPGAPFAVQGSVSWQF